MRRSPLSPRNTARSTGGSARPSARKSPLALKGPAERPAPGEEVAPGVMLKAAKGRVVLSGKGVDAALQEALRGWLAAR